MKGVRRILGFMRPYKRPLILATILTGGLTLIGMAPPLLMRRLVNDVARQGRWGILPVVTGLRLAAPPLRAAANVAGTVRCADRTRCTGTWESRRPAVSGLH